MTPISNPMVEDVARIAGESSSGDGPRRGSKCKLMVAVLAGGASRRLGQPKQMVEIEGESLLRRQCRMALEAQIGPVAVVLGYRASDCAELVADLNVARHVNLTWAEGLASSIRCAAQSAIAVNADGLLLLHVDQYRLMSADLQSLHAAWTERPSGPCVATYDMDFGPPVIFPSSIFSKLLLLKGEHGAHQLLAALPNQAMRRVAVLNAIHDLDVPAQLAALAAGSGG